VALLLEGHVHVPGNLAGLLLRSVLEYHLGF
jgi:hypothetical protein